MNVPFLATPYPSPATQVNFPGIGSQFATTVQISGGTAPYNAQASSNCGTLGASTVSISRVGTNQFTIVPTQAGAACVVTFSDSSNPAQTTILTVTVNGGTTGAVT